MHDQPKRENWFLDSFRRHDEEDSGYNPGDQYSDDDRAVPGQFLTADVQGETSSKDGVAEEESSDEVDTFELLPFRGFDCCMLGGKFQTPLD